MARDFDEGEHRRQEPQEGMARPWHFKGAKGACFLHPEARIISIATEIIYDNVVDPPKFIGNGCILTFQVPTPSGDWLADKIFVLESSDEVQDQILSRGGWR